MATPTAATRLSTGIESLDHLIEGLLWGECVVFHTSESSEYVSFLRPLFSFLSSQKIPTSWISFSNKDASIQFHDTPILQSHLILPTNLEQVLEKISKTMQTAAPTFFIFEELTELRRLPNGEAEIVPAVERIAENLTNGNGSAYLQMRKGTLSDSTVAQIKDRVTVFMDLWKVDDALFFQPIKVLGRYSKKLFKAYQYSDGAIRPTEGIEFEEYARALENKSREFLELYSQKRHIETDLQRKVFELSLINGITASLLSTMNLDEILYRILVGVTAKEGLGFNRAFLLLVNDAENVLEGKIAIGPSSLEEAMEIWMDLNNRHLTFSDLLACFDEGSLQHDIHVNEIVKNIRVSLEDRSHILTSLLMQMQPVIIGQGGNWTHPHAEELLKLFEVHSFAAVPLLYRKRKLGLLIADNLVTQQAISEEDLLILETFANYASTAIEHSRLYEEVRRRVKESERHINQLEAMQGRLLRSKKLSELGELASKMAHEVRTPLVSIGGFANAMLKRHGPASPDYEDLKIIVNEVRRLEGIIKNVLAYVSPGIPRTEWTDLKELVHKVVNLLKVFFTENKIDVVIQLGKDIPQVRVDPEQIKLVLTAILNNAVESMPSGGRLTLAISHNNEFVRLAIADTGDGISEENLSKVFDAFFTTKSLGSGLGLNIASQIIANHKGSIYLDSKLSEGSTFCINLPLSVR